MSGWPCGYSSPARYRSFVRRAPSWQDIRRLAELVDARRDALEVRDALLAVEEVVVVGAYLGVGMQPRTGKMILALLLFGLPPAVRNTDQPARHVGPDRG